jgi:hypothetical protein
MYRRNSKTGSKPVSVRAQAPSAHVYMARTDERWAKGRKGWKIKDEWVEVVSYVSYVIEATKPADNVRLL